MPRAMQAPTYDEIGRWLETATASTQKTAKAKSASEMETSGQGTKDPGGYTGASSHPSARNASNTQSAPMGARAKENEADNKEDRGPASVDSVSPSSGGDQDDKQIHVGMNPSSTGEDPSVEDDYKSDKEDGTTAHPADAEDVGEKYSSWKLDRLCKTAESLQNNILANITMGFGFEDVAKQPVRKTAAANSKAQNNRSNSSSAPSNETVQQGYELAALMGLTKQAADENVSLFLAGMMKEAAEDADSVGAFLAGYVQKLAEEEAAELQGGEDHGSLGGAGGGEELPPELLAAMQGGGGGAPGGEGGGVPGGGLGEPGGEGGSEEDDMQQLAMALMEAGIPPEKLPELVAAAQGASGEGDGGGLPPGGDAMLGGGGGAEPPSPAEMGAKIASAVTSYKRSGKFRFSEAKTAAQRRKRDAMKNYILEIAGQR